MQLKYNFVCITLNDINMIKVILYCLFVLAFTAWAQDQEVLNQLQPVKRNYGCPTGCSCTLVPATGCTAVGGGTCACATVGPSGAFTGCTISGIAPSGSGVDPNGCVNGNTVNCVDFRVDANNCGGCSKPCASGTCASSTCVACANTCSGICTNVQTDPNNCGACNTKCPVGVNCISGTCTCPPGQRLCPSTPGSTAQVCTTIDADQCTACDVPCTGASTICTVSGTPSIGTCSSGGYTELQCTSTGDSALSTIGTPQGSMISSGSVSNTQCYNYCLNALSQLSTPLTLTYFTLSQDTQSNGVNMVCLCYSGTLTGTPATATGCTKGYGITNVGNGVVQLYSNP